MTESELKMLNELNFSDVHLEELPILSFPSLERIYLSSVTTKKAINFEKSNLPKLCYLTIYSLNAVEGFESQVKIKTLPFPNLA